MSERELKIVESYPEWLKMIQKKLEAASSGDVYGPESNMTPAEFIDERGGYTDRKLYLKSLELY